MKNAVLFLSVFCLFFSLSACGDNNNIFSWAHDEGSGDYASLMSDADTAMKNSEFSKAARYYKKAINKKPNSVDAIYGYSSAVITDALGKKVNDIYTAVANEKGSEIQSIINSLTGDKKIENALAEILNPNMLPATLLGPDEGKTDRNLNAAISYLIYGIMLSINDPAIQGKFSVGNDYTITVSPENYDAVKQSLQSNLIPNIQKAISCLDNIVNMNNQEGETASRIRSVLTQFSDKINAM